MVKTQVGIYTIVIILFGWVVWSFERVIKNRAMKRYIYYVVFCGYCISVLWFTLLSRQPLNERIAFLTPFRSYPSAYQDYLVHCSNAAKDGIVTFIDKIRALLEGYNWLILNVLLFIPYGILTSMIFPQKKRSKLFIYGVLISVIIELIQYLSRLGCFDIDDLIQNAIGIGIGCLLANLLQSRQQVANNGE